MPNRDRGGNAGRGAGQGRGRAAGRPLGSDVCTCPKCGHEIPHTQRGIPCSQIACPKCKTMMKGMYC